MSIGVLMSVTIVAFQSLGVGTAMPAIARDLGGLGCYGWAFSAFMLASMVGSVAAGRDADAHGPLRAYLAAIAAFAAGSLLAALAWSWGALMAGRALEGLGSGALGVVAYVSASRAYPTEMYGAHARADVVGLGAAVAGRPRARGHHRRDDHLALGLRLPAPLPPDRGRAHAAGPAERWPPWPARRPAAASCARGPARAPGSPCSSPRSSCGRRSRPSRSRWPARARDPLPARAAPAGTLRAARGLPSGILVRGLLAIAFLGCDAFMPLALTELAGFSLARPASSSAWRR